MAVFLYPRSLPHRVLTEFARFFVPQTVAGVRGRLPEDGTRDGRRAFGAALRDLERRGLVHAGVGPEGATAFPTPRGRKLLALSRLPRTVDPATPRSRDVLVTYDIPRTLNTARDLFRRFLRRVGFIGLHHSAWVGPSTALPHVIDYVVERGLNPRVHWAPWRRTRGR